MIRIPTYYLRITFGFLPLYSPNLYAQQPDYPCQNKSYEYLAVLLGTWDVTTTDRTSPGVYESNFGVSRIENLMRGCGVRETFRGTFKEKEYAREVMIAGIGDSLVQLLAMDSEHGEFLEFRGEIKHNILTAVWYRDQELRRLQSKYILTITNADQFEFSSFLSTDHGISWALTHARKYQRKGGP